MSFLVARAAEFHAVFNPDFLRGYGTGVLNGSFGPLQWSCSLSFASAAVFFSKNPNQWTCFCFLLFIAGPLQSSSMLFGSLKHKTNFFAVTFLPHYYLFFLPVWWCGKSKHITPHWSMERVSLAHDISFVCLRGSRFFNYFFHCKILLSVFTILAAYTFPKLVENCWRETTYPTEYIFITCLWSICWWRKIKFLPLIISFLALFRHSCLGILSWKFVEEKFIQRRKSSLLRQ